MRWDGCSPLLVRRTHGVPPRRGHGCSEHPVVSLGDRSHPQLSLPVEHTRVARRDHTATWWGSGTDWHRAPPGPHQSRSREKVDPASTGSQGLFAFQLTLGPTDSLPVHRHHRDDELIFVHAGEVSALVGDERRPAPAGTTLFIPAGRRVGLANSGTAIARLLVVFAAPHMAEYIRSLGSPPGAPPRELTLELLQELGRRHHITFP
jgi:quercetin dioxygenase-like cupin family protein